MESLYFIGRAQFHQLATHVSCYHEDSSPAYTRLGEECLRSAGLKPEKYTFWNVPQMREYLGKTVPLDVHGGHVLVDEEKALPMASSYGVLRYAFLTSAVRAKEGGRWRYDFTTMNLTLGAGVAVGFASLSFGRKRFGWMRRHPIGAVTASFFTCLVTTVLCRQGIKFLGFGIVQAQRSHKKALMGLQCQDCLDDVNDYTRKQIEELRGQKVPQQPGMPPPPEEFVKRFERGIELQTKLLDVDMEEVRLIKRRTGPKVCQVHEGLRHDPAGYMAPDGLALLKSDRERAMKREPLPVAE